MEAPQSSILQHTERGEVFVEEFLFYFILIPIAKNCCCYPSGIVHAVADILLMCWSLKHKNRQNSEGLHVFI